jgi:hypothetical protein
MLTSATATRTNGIITVRLIGQYPTPCDEATIVDYYPGTVMNTTDPCSAQIFIREGRKLGMENMDCTQVLGGIWTLNHNFLDNYHKTVEIFINNCFARKIRVLEHTHRGMYNLIGF